MFLTEKKEAFQDYSNDTNSFSHLYQVEASCVFQKHRLAALKTPLQSNKAILHGSCLFHCHPSELLFLRKMQFLKTEPLEEYNFLFTQKKSKTNWDTSFCLCTLHSSAKLAETFSTWREQTTAIEKKGFHIIYHISPDVWIKVWQSLSHLICMF